MEYDPQDYYSDGGEEEPGELPSSQASGVEKPEAPPRRPKKKLTAAKLEQLRRAREAKALKRKEKQNTTLAKKPRVVRKTLQPTPEEDLEIDEIVVAPQRKKKRKKRIIVQAPQSESSDDDYEVQYQPPRRATQRQPQPPPPKPTYTEEPSYEYSQPDEYVYHEQPSSIFY